MTHRTFLPALLLAVAATFAETNVLGTAVDAASDLPLPKAQAFSADSSFLGSSDAQGRFELRLERPIEVTFRKEGYKDKVVALADVSDLLDLTVALEPLGSALEGRTVVARADGRSRQPPGSIAVLESVGGMRMDLQDHLRNLPGVSGAREFSSELSIYGCRTADVAHILGPFRIPNLRHLDYSFPGNESVLNPRMLQGVSVEHDPTTGPLEQGLASALRYLPLRPATDHHEFVLSWGLTNRELDAYGPVGNGSYALSGRWLDPSLMDHLASRFFVGSRGDASTASGSNAAATQADSKLDLSAFDGYARFEQGFGDFAASATALGSSDAHTIKLLQTRDDGSTAYPVVQQGEKTDLVAFGELQGQTTWGWLDAYGGTVRGREVLQLSDTMQRDATTDEASFAQAMDWAAWTRDNTDDRAGFGLQPDWDLGGARAEILAAYDLIGDSRSLGRDFQTFGTGLNEDRTYMGGGAGKDAPSDDLVRSRLHGMFRLRKASDHDSTRWGVSVGGLWAQGAGGGAEGTLSWMGPAFGLGWTANLTRRLDDHDEATSFARLGARLSTSDEAKLGAGRRLGPVEVTSTVYWRNIQDPQLPEAPFFWTFPYAQRPGSATVWGGTMQAKWTTWHYLQAQTNFSRVQGEYDFGDGRTMDWDANRDFDAWTVVKIHPRGDSLFSIILSHSASLGKPEYRFSIDTAARTLSVSGDPVSWQHPSYTDQFRTDARVELDIPTNLPPMRSVRFYVEVQNIFGQFSGDWARPLGGDNFRQRSWSPVRTTVLTSTGPSTSKGTIEGAEPLYARGTDLLVTFGIEGKLGI
jgi:hypothetical protein